MPADTWPPGPAAPIWSYSVGEPPPPETVTFAPPWDILVPGRPAWSLSVADPVSNYIPPSEWDAAFLGRRGPRSYSLAGLGPAPPPTFRPFFVAGSSGTGTGTR